MNVLLIGEESAGIQTLRALAQSNHRLVGVMAAPDKKTIGEANLWNVAEKLGCPTWPAPMVKDPHFAETVRAAQVDLLFNVHSLFVIHKEILRAPRIGSFNLHPGPLPRYAGLNTVSWAIYRGENTYGVTLHKMAPEIDAGPIVYQSFFKIEDTDTALSLYAKCMRAGLPLLLQLLETASTHPEAIPLVPQDLTQREYFGKAIPEGGWLRWSRPAHEIINFVRACDYAPFPSPWGHPQVKKGDQTLGIVKASLTGQPSAAIPGTVGQWVNSGIQIACADEWIVVRQLMVEGKYLGPEKILIPGDRLTGAH